MTTTEHTPITRHRIPGRAIRWTIGSLAVVVVVSVIAGVVAALFGGSLTDLGSGAGGLYGIPSLLTTAIALLVAMPVAVLTARRADRVAGRLRLMPVREFEVHKSRRPGHRLGEEGCTLIGGPSRPAAFGSAPASHNPGTP